LNLSDPYQQREVSIFRQKKSMHIFKIFFCEVSRQKKIEQAATD
jgi:hypothetical protein